MSFLNFVVTVIYNPKFNDYTLAVMITAKQ